MTAVAAEPFGADPFAAPFAAEPFEAELLGAEPFGVVLPDPVWDGDPAGWPEDSAAWGPAGQADQGGEPPPLDDPGDRMPWELEGPDPWFAEGGPAGELAPGPALAEMTGAAWQDGLSALPDDELIGIAQAARRLCSWQAALELAAAAELTRRRVAETEAMAAVAQDGPPLVRAGLARDDAEAGAAAELAAALTLTSRAADELMFVASALDRLPAVAAALRDGVIDRARAAVFARELALLGDVAAAAVAAAVLARAGQMTTGRLREALRREVLAVDPDAARARRENAHAETRVESWAESSGNHVLAGRELPAAQVAAALANLTAIARALQDAGVLGTLDQVRAAVFLALLSGRSPQSLLTPQAAVPPGPDPADGDTRNRAGRSAGSAIDWPDGPLGSVHLTMPLASWLGLSEVPGRIGGLGWADAGTCADLATMLGNRPGTTWCLTVTDATGRALGHACARDRPPRGSGPGPPITEWLAGLTMTWLERDPCSHARYSESYRPRPLLRHLIQIRNPTCTFPGCRRRSVACDLDHVKPYQAGGPTCECNLHPLCRRHHRCKQRPGWKLEQPAPGELAWTMPHGRRYATTPEPYS